MDILDRARLYTRSLPPAVQGQGGNLATFLAATSLVVGFELSEEEALQILREEFNSRCKPEWAEIDLARKVKSAASSGKPPPGCRRGWLIGSGASREDRIPRREVDRERAAPAACPPNVEAPGRLPFDVSALRRCFRAELGKAEWFVRRSPLPVENMGPAEFLAHVFTPEDRVLIFTLKRSQGQFMAYRGGIWKLGRAPHHEPEPGALPPGGPDGCWFLVQPVNGEWLPNEDGNLSRRSGPNIVSYPYLVIEQDPPKTEDPGEMRALWLSFLAQLPLPIVSVYESAGKSIHALVRVGCRTAEEFNEYKRLLLPVLTRYGADYAAIRPVQLSRLPGCYRGERLQRLLYLNPAADPRGIPIAEP